MPSLKACWDACVFISILKGEVRSPDEMNGLREMMDLVDRKQATLITSALVEAEVIGLVDQLDVQQRLEAIFERPNIVQVAASNEVFRKAGALRRAAQQAGRSVKTPDSIYIATALLHSADVLHTFDQKLLALDGSVVVDGLPITTPRGEQTILQLG